MREMFQIVWGMAVQGTFMMLCALVLRRFLKGLGLSGNLPCLLWALLAFRLILPWSIPVSLPEGMLAKTVLEQEQPREDGRITEGVFSDGGLQRSSGITRGAVQPVTESVPETELQSSRWSDAAGGQAAFWRIAPVLWILGTAAAGLGWTALNLRLRSRVREAVLIREMSSEYRVMECERIETAFVLGLFRPAIYLPAALEASDRRYVLLHEMAHLRRKDHIWKWAACLLLCIYWFHPLMWVCVSAFAEDVEEACDEAVLKQLGKSGKLPYARAIFHAADTGGAGRMSVPGFGEGNMKKRVKHVLEYRKNTAAAIILGMVLVLGACGPFFLEKETGKENDVHDGITVPAGGEGAEESAEAVGSDDGGSVEAESPDAEGSAEAALPDNGGSVENAENGWTLLAVEEDALTDPLMAADACRVILRKSEGAAEAVQISYELPVKDARISDSYCVREHPLTGERRLHSGVDFAADEGSAVLAAADGIVAETGFTSACGNYVILRHENGDLTYYAHCAEILAEPGAFVETGEQIASVGSTGISTGPHLHFALSRDGMFLDPSAELERQDEGSSEAVRRK